MLKWMGWTISDKKNKCWNECLLSKYKGEVGWITIEW